MNSRLSKALRKLGKKCTPEGTQVTGDNVDGLLECIAEHYVNDGNINVADFQLVMEKATDITLDRSCETVSEVISALAEKLSYGQMNGEFEYAENLTDGEVTSYTIKGIGSVTNTDIVFPTTYNGKPVTMINGSAFRDNTAITSIVIPDSYTSLAMDTFRGCTALESAVIGKGATTIGERLFYQAGLKSIKFNGTIAKIGSYAFHSCDLVLIDFSNNTSVPTIIDVTVFVGLEDGCKIIVPDALYDEWIAASMWVDLENATYVKASEYTGV